MEEKVPPVEVAITITAATIPYLEEVLSDIERIQKEHNCRCTLSVKLG